jgi:hypothetical protein
MKTTAIACVLLLLTSCGGGSGGALPAATETPGVNDSALERTREILETCTLEDLDRFLSLIDLLGGATEGTEGPDLQVENFDFGTLTVGYTIDLDRDGAIDLRGTVRFEDAQGIPTFPFDIADILGGDPDLASLLASIPDGTVVYVTFASVPDGQVSGAFDFTMLEGVATELDGTVTITSSECVIVLEFQDAGSGTTGSLGEIVANGTITSTSGNAVGNVTFDGSSQVLLDMTLDGGVEVYTFAYDVETGELTQVT